MISLIVSEENPTLPKDILTVFNDVKVFTMKYYPGHGIRRDEQVRMYNELSQIKREVEKADVILYARSYGVFDSKGMKKLKEFFSKPVVISTEAIIDKLRELKANNLYVVTPYNQRRHDYEIKWLYDLGFKVVGSIALGRTGGPAIASTPHELVINAVKVAQESSADAIYVACTILSTLPILDKLSGRLPVVTAASATVDKAKEIINLKKNV
ncbi:maleate cis-trans isomerase [Acidianus sulfidivorans JP7]|uniref:Maleate cis-trans isomerase n=1 Tax=Acidianus sulfidivorans JP7 TaxID=619593 RepID=A0A2U9IN80_9CREN|nr:maleate cis-trans isomerase [Acidianus sulfidivorans]AWR97470.1 maleate cis-trans isomerase [Acidianus sulfidivorans JP7]